MTEEEKDLIYRLAQKLTGAHPEGTYQIGIFLTNIQRRMREKGVEHLSDYLEQTEHNPEEHAHLLSALSIHTTAWFRENPHYVILQKILLARTNTLPFEMWSCATSTGEEIYSFGLLFEEFRRFHPDFDYRILGTDIDPISLATARKGIYDRKHLTGPISFYKKHVLLGSEKTEGLFTFSPELRQRCHFQSQDIRIPKKMDRTFDLIVCRNVLIYFQAKTVEDVIRYLCDQLNPGGHLILGHSEIIDYQKFNLTLRGHAVYEKPSPDARPTPTLRNATADQRSILDLAPPNRAQKVRSYEPAVTLEPTRPGFMPKLILVGASTGGPQALAETLWSLPPDCPPVVIAQHISSPFALHFAERLAEVSGLKLGRMGDEEPLLQGHLYSANADQHIGVHKVGAHYLRINDNSPGINGHRPSVDFLFRSARALAPECIVILLSGMGRDGALEFGELFRGGAYAIAQSENDCVVFGMPKEVIQRKTVNFIGSAEQIHEKIFELIQPQPTLDR